MSVLSYGQNTEDQNYNSVTIATCTYLAIVYLTCSELVLFLSLCLIVQQVQTHPVVTTARSISSIPTSAPKDLTIRLSPGWPTSFIVMFDDIDVVEADIVVCVCEFIKSEPVHISEDTGCDI